MYELHHLSVDIADCDHNMGNVLDNTGRYAEAEQAYQSARHVYAANDLPVRVAGSDFNLGLFLEPWPCRGG